MRVWIEINPLEWYITPLVYNADWFPNERVYCWLCFSLRIAKKSTKKPEDVIGP